MNIVFKKDLRPTFLGKGFIRIFVLYWYYILLYFNLVVFNYRLLYTIVLLFLDYKAL